MVWSRRAQLFLLGRYRCFELFDGCVQRVGIGLLRLDGKTRSRSAPAAAAMSCSSQVVRAASSRTRFCERRSASGRSPKSVHLASLQSRSRQTRRFLVLSLGRAETFLFALPLLGERGALLCVGLGVSQALGQLSRQLAGRPIGEVASDASRQRRDIPRELVGVAVDAANPALVVAAIGQFFEQLADLVQEDLGLLGRGVGFQTDAGHHHGPLGSPGGQLGLGRLERELGGGPLGSGPSRAWFPASCAFGTGRRAA